MNTSEVKLINCVLSQPIERIRGGSIVVAVTCTFEDSINKQYVFSGISTTEEQRDPSFEACFTAAVQNAVSNFEKYTSFKVGIPKEILLAIMEPKKKDLQERALSKAKNDPKLEDEILAALNAPADEHRQKLINQVCESLGFQTINVLDGSWTLLESQTLLATLEDLARPLELK